MQAFLDSLKLEVAARQVSRCRQPFEIVGLKLCCLICAEESMVGVTPGVTFVTLTSVFKMVHLKSLLSRTIRRPHIRNPADSE
jgi:hypothetical protein